MEFSARVTPIDEIYPNRWRYILRLNKYLYGLKSSGQNWFEKLQSGLTDKNFVQIQLDKYVSYRYGCIILTYVDDWIIIGKSMEIVDSIIYSLCDGYEYF